MQDGRDVALIRDALLRIGDADEDVAEIVTGHGGLEHHPRLLGLEISGVGCPMEMAKEHLPEILRVWSMAKSSWVRRNTPVTFLPAGAC